MLIWMEVPWSQKFIVEEKTFPKSMRNHRKIYIGIPKEMSMFVPKELGTLTFGVILKEFETIKHPHTMQSEGLLV